MSEFLASIPPVAVCFIVCAAKIIEITIQSLKTCMMVKGQRLKAAALGFVECSIWGLVISTIISTLGDNLALLAFYCGGYAMGLFLGSTLEGKIALGTSNLQLIANDPNTEKIVDYLKEKGRRLLAVLKSLCFKMLLQDRCCGNGMSWSKADCRSFE